MREAKTVYAHRRSNLNGRRPALPPPIIHSSSNHPPSHIGPTPSKRSAVPGTRYFLSLRSSLHLRGLRGPASLEPAFAVEKPPHLLRQNTGRSGPATHDA